MKKVKFLAFITFLCLLSGCATADSEIDYENITSELETTTEKTTKKDIETMSYDEETTTSYEDFLANQPYHVSNYIGINKNDNTKIETIAYGLDYSQNDIPYEIGYIVFVNGIPQQLQEAEGNRVYLPIVSVDSEEDKEIVYTCLHNNVPEADEYICKVTRILMPDVLITDQWNFYFGHMQTMAGHPTSEKVVCEPSGDVDINKITGTKTTYEEGLFSTNLLAVGDFDGEYQPTVIERDNCSKKYILEITPEISGAYVISFWGNCNPIQIGEHMFYEVEVEAGDKYQYSFELTEEQINTIDNFYAIVCPVDADIRIGKTDTKIFVDEYRK